MKKRSITSEALGPLGSVNEPDASPPDQAWGPMSTDHSVTQGFPALSFQVVRLTWAQVFLTWPETVAVLRGLLATGRHRGGREGVHRFAGVHGRLPCKR